MKYRYLLLYIFSFLISIIYTDKAEAIPSFARKTTFSCNVCHSTSFPRLNSFGWQFKENGYQIKGADKQFQEQFTIKMEESIELLKNVPFALRVRNNIQVRQEEPRIDFQLPKEIEFLAGGRVFENISFFYSQALGTTLITPESIEKSFVIFSNLDKNNLFNIKVGKFNLMEWNVPYDKSLTLSKYLIENNEIGVNPFKLDSNQVGIELYGRPFDGSFFYNLALVNGKYDSISLEDSFDNNSFKDVTGGLNYTFDTHRIGVWGYYGQNSINIREPITNQLKITQLKNITNNFYFYNTGISLNLDFSPLVIQGIYSISQNFNKENDFLHGGFLEAIYMFKPDFLEYSSFLALARYDNVISKTNNNMSQSITGSLQFLPIQNLNIGLEYTYNLLDMNKNLAILKMDLAF
ncbi:MAG: hypothetical protein ACK4IX_00710 [Candidatus Sericytochromatia bacterium]